MQPLSLFKNIDLTKKSNTKFLTIMDWSRKQNLSGCQAEKHNWNCISSEKGKCDVLFLDASTYCLTSIPLHTQTSFSR